MEADQLKQRTKKFSLNVMEYIEALPTSNVTSVLSRQLLRSATSVGANYRAACRARSKADFISKIGIVEEEADEAAYWLELFLEANTFDGKRVKNLLAEANELVAIFTASGRTAKRGIG